jgi:hypothetical protein
MPKRARPRDTSFDRRTIDELEVEDERSFRSVAMYADLEEILRLEKYTFRVLPKSHAGRADRALLLNLTFWDATSGGDVLASARIDADVVAHVAWHHLASRAFAPKRGEGLSVEALFLGEAIASAFDVYLVGRLLRDAPRSKFLETQVVAMAEATNAAGLGRRDFERLLHCMVANPERAFADLRALLSDATAALFACGGAEEAHAALAAFDGHRFSALLHRYELSNWVLYARAYDTDHAETPRARARSSERTRAVDRGLRDEKAPLAWLAARWIGPALAGGL